MAVARVVDEDELIDRWTLVGDELGEVAGKRGATRLGFAILLKFYSCHGRFPRGRAEVPDEVIAYVARQVRFLRLTWGSTSGADGPSSTTGPRSAHFWGFVSAPSLMRTSSRRGWPSMCACLLCT